MQRELTIEHSALERGKSAHEQSRFSEQSGGKNQP